MSAAAALFTLARCVECTRAEVVRDETGQRRMREVCLSCGSPVKLIEVETVAGTNAEIRDVFAHWQTATGHLQAKLDQARRSKIQARLRDGFTVAELCRAIDGVAAFPYVTANGRDRTGTAKERHDDISLVCRSASHVERFMALAPADGASGLTAKLVGA